MAGTSAGNFAHGHGTPHTTKCVKPQMQHSDYHSP